MNLLAARETYYILLDNLNRGQGDDTSCMNFAFSIEFFQGDQLLVRSFILIGLASAVLTIILIYTS